jgi:hypothetical protein
MQLPLRVIRFRRAPEPAEAPPPVARRAQDEDPPERSAERAAREQEAIRHLRARGIWDTFLHCGSGPTLRR